MRWTLTVAVFAITLSVATAAEAACKKGPAAPAAGEGHRFGKPLTAPSAYATGLAFDGEALWMADRRDGKLYRLSPTDGKVLATLDAPGMVLD